MSNIGSKLFGFADKLINFTKNFEKIPNLYPEIAVLILFPVLIAVFGYFHEPWFDEAQAWQIAKCASFKEILFYLPHFEGHPPLWHIILSIFAKNNFPYEITIKSLSFIFSYLGVILILFKSPFYRIIKIFLPFTYFLFYDSTIISRPYCLVLLSFSLLAIYYHKKNEKPFKYALCLVLLSMTQAFSFVIASFLTLMWFIEAVKDKAFRFKKHFPVFLLLFIFYVALALILIPSGEASTIHVDYIAGIKRRLIYALFIIPADCFISHIGSYLPNDDLTNVELILGLFVSSFFWFFLYYFTKNKNTFLTFLVPYIPFAFFASKYFAIPHTTIPFCFIIFICWITLNCPKNKEETNNSIKRIFGLIILISLIISLYWNFKSCILDIFIPFAKGKQEAEFIKKYHLDDYKIMVEWDDNKTNPHPNMHKTWQSVAPYFEKNIFYNFNDGDSRKNYVIMKDLTKQEVQDTYARWEKQGLPYVMAGEIDLDKIYKNSKAGDEYIVGYYNTTNYIRKGILLSEQSVPIFIKKDLAKKLDIKPITPEYKSYKVDLFTITSYVFAKLFVWLDEHKGTAK